MLIRRIRNAVLVVCIPLVTGSSSLLRAQTSGGCATDRALSALVGAGIGGAVGAIPATIVHRHDQTSSHRIVAVSISAGALIGFAAAGRDRPCISSSDSSRVGDVVIATRSRHAWHGALMGAIVGGVAGAVGGTFYNIGCDRDPCDGQRARANLMMFSAGEGALAGGILGILIGWAWPAGR